MDREEFIESQVAFQLGTLNAAPAIDLAEFARAEAPDRASLVLHDPADQSFIPEERGAGLTKTKSGRWRCDLPDSANIGQAMKATRNAELLSDLYAGGIAAPLIADMHDAVWNTNAFPVFQYNRLSGAANSILWPLRRVHEIGQKSFCQPPDPGEPPLRDKKMGVCWRGSLRGFSTYGGEPRNVRSIIKLYLDRKIDRDLLLAHLGTVPRYAFVSRYFDQKGFDVGFREPKAQSHYHQVPDIARYEKPYVDPAEQLRHRYLISIQGNDVGSSFGWQLGTNSVILKEPYPWEVFFDGHFRPWDHYVPVAADFSDVAEKIAWCEDHRRDCRQMAKRRHEAVRLLLDPDTRREALRHVVARYNAFHEDWARKA